MSGKSDSTLCAQDTAEVSAKFSQYLSVQMAVNGISNFVFNVLICYFLQRDPLPLSNVAADFFLTAAILTVILGVLQPLTTRQNYRKGKIPPIPYHQADHLLFRHWRRGFLGMLASALVFSLVLSTPYCIGVAAIFGLFPIGRVPLALMKGIFCGVISIFCCYFFIPGTIWAVEKAEPLPTNPQ